MEIQITQTIPVLRTPKANGVFIQWNLPSPPSIGIKAFKLERSGSPEGPFELVIDNLTEFHFFDDLRSSPTAATGETRENLNFLSLSRVIYYKITVTDDSGNTATSTKVVGATLASRKIALLRRKMQRDLAVVFKFSGVDLAILKRRHWGTRCTVCFDALTKKVTDSKCLTCFGTSFEGGYFTPVRVSGRIGVQNVQTNITPQGKADTNKKRLTILAYPEVEVDDIIVDIKQNKRYIVQHRNTTELKTVPVHQALTVSELARDSIEYRILANMDATPTIY